MLSAEYTIQNFENLRPEATPFRDSITAYWSGFYHEANRLPDPNIDEEAKGFLKNVEKKQSYRQALSRKSENGFYFGISNHDFTEEGTEGFHGGGPIDTELGTDLFASYVHPCATQING